MHSSRMRTVRSSDRISGEGCLLRGVSAPGGICSGGICFLGGSAPRGCVSGLGGCLLLGGVCSQGCLLWEGCAPGGCLLPGSMVSQHALRQTQPRGQTDACKNITFATSLRAVITLCGIFDTKQAKSASETAFEIHQLVNAQAHNIHTGCFVSLE